MDTLDLLTRLYAVGVTVEPADGDGLQLRGRPCPPDLKSEAIDHKPAILATLRAHRIGEPSDHPGIAPPIRYVVPCRNVACPVLGPCAWHLKGEACPFASEPLEGAA